MNRIFTLLTLIVLSLTTSLSAQDVPFRLNLDNADAVTVTVNDEPKNSLATGSNEFNVDRGSYVRVTANDGFRLVSVKEVDGTWEDDLPLNAEDGKQFCDIYVFSDYGSTYYVTTENASDARTAQCTVRVDDASKVKAVCLRDESALALTDGDNTYSFDPATENKLRITPVDKSLYAVSLNGENVPGNGYSYEVTVADGDLLKIEADYPDVPVAVHFNVTGQDSEDFITGVDVDGKAVFNWTDPDFSVPCGAEVKVYGRTNEYEVTAFEVNGTAQMFSNPYVFMATEETTLDIAVQKYASFKMTVNIDHPERVHLYKGYSYNGDEYELQAGENTVEVMRNTPIISIVTAEGFYLESVVIDDYEYDAEELHLTPLMAGSLTASSVLTIRTGIIERNQMALINVAGLDKAEGNLHLLRADGSEVELVEGDNSIAYYAGDNPFRLNATGTAVDITVTQGGKEVEMTYPDSRIFAFTLSPDAPVQVVIGGTLSGIENAGSRPNTRGEVFNLQGISLGHPASLPRGIYIINGRKVVR